MTKVELIKEKNELEKKLAHPELFRDAEALKNLSIEYAKIEKMLALLIQKEESLKEQSDIEEMLKSDDPEIVVMAEEEKKRILEEQSNIEKKLSGDESATPQDVIMEIRAGTGGDEASLFAKELFDMYYHYAEKKGWKTSLVDESPSSLEGYKEVIFEINGSGVYEALRWESGVHRVQRVPATEKMGRIHTSTISVAVLPKAREVDVEIRPQDIKIEFFRSSGPGGQNVNKVETAVRIYHLPSGLIVASQESRSQQKNREKALTVLRSRLLDHRMQAEAKKIAAERKLQIGTGDRSEKIRTYNFPQDRITDHRVKESWHNIEFILAGNLDNIIDTLKELSAEPTL